MRAVITGGAGFLGSHLCDRLIEQGWEVVVTHGNGPQVGFIHRRSELSRHELHDVPLDFCGADTQGSIVVTTNGQTVDVMTERNT